MVKRLIIVMVIVFIFSYTLVGCGEKYDSVTTTEKVKTAMPESASPIEEDTLDAKLYNKLLADCLENSLLEYPDTVENEILLTFLPWEHETRHYVVVKPETSLGSNVDYEQNYTYMKGIRNWVNEWFSEQGYDVSDLYDEFLKVNKNPSLLTVPSSLSKGYYIDYNENFEKYATELWGGTGSIWREGLFWEFRRENLHSFSGFLRLSIPVYDPDTGYVLILVGYTGDALYGSGYLKLFKNESGNLTELSELELWVS